MLRLENFELSEGYLIVKEKESEKVLSSGIIIPDTAKKKIANMGKVVKTSCGIAEGTVVIFRKSKGKPIEFDGYPYLIVNEDHVEGICE